MKNAFAKEKEMSRSSAFMLRLYVLLCISCFTPVQAQTITPPYPFTNYPSRAAAWHACEANIPSAIEYFTGVNGAPFAPPNHYVVRAYCDEAAVPENNMLMDVSPTLDIVSLGNPPYSQTSYISMSAFDVEYLIPCSGSNQSASCGKYNPPKNLGCNCTQTANKPMDGDPVNLLTGNTYTEQDDFGQGDLLLSRYYNSDPNVHGGHNGVQWLTNYDRNLSFNSSGIDASSGLPSSPSQVTVQRQNGQELTFNKVSGVWQSDADVNNVLTEADDASGYVLSWTLFVAATRQYETYSPMGSLLSVSDGTHALLTLTYTDGTTQQSSTGSVLPGGFGPMSGYTLGNGQAITRTYDANYRLTDLVSPAFTLHVARDAMGNITAIGNGTGANPATETYSYDPLYRLTAITEADGTALESVTYNQTGDRLTKTGSGLATGTYGYNSNTHQLIATGNAARTVDANGNTTAISQAGGAYGFGYNARNRMAVAQLNQSTIASYSYNAAGERVAKTSSGTTERYNYGAGSQLLSEYGATNREYVYVDDIPVANLDTQGTATSIAYVTADELGSPRAVADGSGNTVWAWAYQGNAWGEQAPTSNGYTYNLRFPGQYFDQETGLNYNVNRDYDPNSGRYNESDPRGLFSGQLSTYTYVDNSPTAYVDPLGLAKHDPNSLYCRQLADRIKGVMADQDKRWRELVSNDDTLPQYIGPGESFYATRRGHMTLINQGDQNLRRLQDKYDDDCGPPPPTCPAVDSNKVKDAGNAAIGATAAYWIISEVSRLLFPPRNLVPLP